MPHPGGFIEALEALEQRIGTGNADEARMILDHTIERIKYNARLAPPEGGQREAERHLRHAVLEAIHFADQVLQNGGKPHD